MSPMSLARRVVVFALLGIAVRPGAAQDTTRALPASLLRRLAAAADGHRTGQPLWIVASTVFPHTVVGVFDDRVKAMQVARDSARSYQAYGPYVTPLDFGRMAVFVPPMHCKPTINCWVGERAPTPAWLADDIDSVVITAYHRSGKTWRARSRGLEVDAVFFTLSAVDKFLIPYYTGLYGPGYMARWRDSLGTYIRTAPVK